MQITELIVTHNDVRNVKTISTMLDVLQSGAIFDEAHAYSFHHAGSVNTVIKLSRFPDGKIFVHDGHHRLIAKHIFGYEKLFECEYSFYDWNSYESYTKPNLKNGWYTPFDPLTEVRKAEFFLFKEEVLALPEDQQVDYILNNRYRYCEPREVSTVEEMAQRVLLKNPLLLR
jgi:hypothetical protein